eukprot:NODE_388_length_8234_cov_1.030731.p6 type:complete len:101 gc:universal NODE_388_length_8234_cov_1.030731:6995-6693(-)
MTSLTYLDSFLFMPFSPSGYKKKNRIGSKLLLNLVAFAIAAAVCFVFSVVSIGSNLNFDLVLLSDIVLALISLIEEQDVDLVLRLSGVLIIPSEQFVLFT